MIDVAYVQRMASYNRWQNDNLIGVADRLSDAERRLERGAFFGSIQGTFSHLLWADRMWLSRLAETEKPAAGLTESAQLYPDWDAFKSGRADCDAIILEWSHNLSDDRLKTNLTWFSNSVKAELSKPLWLVVTHFFNHQTHHRGQIHAMLTQAGGKPHETDFFAMPE
jgi:uncharacterized damage-inducible protein DinB